MNFIKTPTPEYRHNGHTARPAQTGVLAWFARLLRTPTPEYKTIATYSGRGDSPER